MKKETGDMQEEESLTEKFERDLMMIWRLGILFIITGIIAFIFVSIYLAGKVCRLF